MQYFARIFLIGNRANWMEILQEKEIFYLCVATALIAAGGYIINDYYDIKIDMVNKPDRVILNKRISRRTGIMFHVIFNLTAIAICLLKLTLNVAIFMGLCGALLWLYSNSLKRTAIWGNLTIALLAFASLAMLALFYQSSINAILFFAFFAFFTTLIREIIKDMEDAKGDEMYGCQTLPIVFGYPFTKQVLYVIITFTLIIQLFSLVFINYKLYTFMLIFSFLPITYLLYLIRMADKQSDFLNLSQYLKYIIIIGIIGMVFV